MSSNLLSIQKSARYEVLGNPEAQHLLFVLHGYGQLAEYFIQNFELLSSNYFIVAPEGTHRFYLNGSSGRVGASWMTKEMRLIDIEENNVYLELLLQKMTQTKKYQSISLLGFSQGGATASRWMVTSKFKFDQFILWACVFPEYVLLDFTNGKLHSASKYFVLGSEDEYFKGNTFEQMNAFYKEQQFEVLNFDGTHKIDSKTLLLLFKI